jgi:MinD-like ATPase involved in chromosome partitioning or flagellar assembly
MTQVIVTNSFRGGTGKSTVISNIGSYLASFGMKVIIVDGDVISPGIHAIFGLDNKSFSTTLTDFLIAKTNIEDAVYDISHNLDLPDDTLYIVPSSLEQKNISQILQDRGSSNKLAKAVKQLTDAYAPDYILIDTHPGLNEEFLVASGVTDKLLNIVRPDNQDFQGLEVTAQIARQLGFKSYVILNKVHKNVNANKLLKNIEGAFKIPVAGILPLAEEIILAQSQYVFSERHPNHPFSRALQNIGAKIFGVKPKVHLEIMHDMMEGARTSTSIAQLKCLPNIPKNICEQYTKDLIRTGFIKKTGKASYLISQKGHNFLKKYKTIRKFVNNFRL